MNSSSLRLLLVLWALFMVNSINGQSERQFTFQGAAARANGMGDAFIGLADDASAIIYNPAGIAQLRKMEISLTTKYKTFYSGAFAATSNNLGFDYASFVYPTKIKGKPFSLGMNYNRAEHYFGNDISFGTSYSINSLRLNSALQISNFISLGLTYNYWFSTGGGSAYVGNTFIGGNRIFGHNFSIGGILHLKDFIPLKLGFRVETPRNLFVFYQNYPELEFPMTYGIGLSYRFLDDRLTAVVDFDYLPYKRASDSAGGLITNGNNMNQFRMGLEYMILSDRFNMAVRSGLKTVPTILNDSDGSQEIGRAFCAGFGVKAGKISIDGSIEAGYSTGSFEADLFTGTFVVFSLSTLYYFQ